MGKAKHAKRFKKLHKLMRKAGMEFLLPPDDLALAAGFSQKQIDKMKASAIAVQCLIVKSDG